MYRIEYIAERELRCEQDDPPWRRAVTPYAEESAAEQEAEWLSLSDDGHVYRVVAE